MTRQPHPSEAGVQEQLARAVYYTAVLIIGPLERYHIVCETLEQATARAERLEREYSHWGRRAMVYGVTPEGWSIPAMPAGGGTAQSANTRIEIHARKEWQRLAFQARNLLAAARKLRSEFAKRATSEEQIAVLREADEILVPLADIEDET